MKSKEFIQKSINFDEICFILPDENTSHLQASLTLPLSQPSFAELNVQITRKLEDKTVLERRSVILSCDFKPSPKIIEWLKDYIPIEPSDKYKITREKHSAELKIVKVRPEDAGVYTCKPGNAVTEATLTVEGMTWSRVGGGVFSYWATRYLGLMCPLGFAETSLVSTSFP